MDLNVTPQTLAEALDYDNSQFYPGVYVALATMLTYPVSTCTAEHSLSSMNETKISSAKYDEGRKIKLPSNPSYSSTQERGY